MTYSTIGDVPMDELDDYLEHYGVKGMRWGVRKKSDGGSDGGGDAPKPKKKKITSQDIKDARIRQEARDREIERASDTLNLAKGRRQQEAAAKALKDAVDEYNNSPDARVSIKFTRMEQVGIGVVSNLLMPGVGTIPAAAIIGLNAYGTRERAPKK